MPSKRALPDLSPEQVIQLQDSLLENADRVLTAALKVLDLGSVGLARSLAILGMEESAKAIAIHQRRVDIAYAPDGEAFVNNRLNGLWASHVKKLQLVHDFLVDELYWFGTGPPDRDETAGYLGAIERWTAEHNTLKQRGFYVDVSDAGDALTPQDVADEESLSDVIRHVHQIGWQLRLGEHIEAKGQAERARDIPPATEAQLAGTREMFAGLDGEVLEAVVASHREGRKGQKLHNDGYRLHVPEPGSNPFANMGKPGYEAETRELISLSERLDSEAEEHGAEPD
jgi:AbiV family abortive infection protein